MNEEETTPAETSSSINRDDHFPEDKGAPSKPQTSNLELQNKEMEVHRHGHVHHQKKWKEYFFQFFMLFLAVFCGFFAEYQLEHKIERDRAKQFISSLYEDLKDDTIRLNRLIEFDNDKIAGLSNMINCYDSVIKDLRATSCTGLLIKHSRSNRSFNLNDRTLRQLANAGGFRLLKKADADSLLDYERTFRQYQNFETTIFQVAQDNVRNTLNELGDFRIIAPMHGTNNATDISGTLSGPLLFTDNRVLLNKWFNELSLYLRVTHGQRNQLTNLKSKAAGLIEYYNTKYHLD